jgi:hypothetical protein
MTPWLAVIGIGEDGLGGISGAARALVETAEILVGGARHLAMVPPGAAERLEWQRPIADTVPLIAARRGKRVAVLASGDPLWYGAGIMLARTFPREEMTILPHPGAFSLAAARLGWPPARSAAPAPRAQPPHAAAGGGRRNAAQGGEAADRARLGPEPDDRVRVSRRQPRGGRQRRRRGVG